jgi:hypothetical protein
MLGRRSCGPRTAATEGGYQTRTYEGRLSASGVSKNQQHRRSQEPFQEFPNVRIAAEEKP